MLYGNSTWRQTLAQPLVARQLAQERYPPVSMQVAVSLAQSEIVRSTNLSNQKLVGAHLLPIGYVVMR